jgi:hypothetical protein
MKARDFDEKFDAGGDVSRDVHWAKARRPNLEIRRVNVDFPAWAVEALDREARRLGLTWQCVGQAVDRGAAGEGGLAH